MDIILYFKLLIKLKIFIANIYWMILRSYSKQVTNNKKSKSEKTLNIIYMYTMFGSF